MLSAQERTTDGTTPAAKSAAKSVDYHAFSRLKRALVKIRKCVGLYAEEFCDELHKDYPSLIKCWQWTREIHHLVEIGLDLDDNWPGAASELILSIAVAEERFIATVRAVLQGENGEPLLECGFWAGYDDPSWAVTAEDCDARLKAAGATGVEFCGRIDDVLLALGLQLDLHGGSNVE